MDRLTLKEKEINQNKIIIRELRDEIEKLQKTEYKTELDKRLQELDIKNNEIMKYQKVINILKQDKDNILLSFNKIKNTIPSSIVIVDKNNNIINLNKKAEELLGINIDKSFGTNIFDISQMKNESISDGILKSENDKKPLSIKSISIKNNKGDIRLTNISHIPMLSSKGDFQGAIMILDDITDTEEIKAELRRKDEDLARLDDRLKNVYNNFKISNKGKISIDEHFSKLIEEKQKEIDSIDKLILLKNKELEKINIKLEKSKSTLQSGENDFRLKNLEIDNTHLEVEDPTKSLTEKMKIFNEIDKSLSTFDSDSLKTKKIDHEGDK